MTTTPTPAGEPLYNLTALTATIDDWAKRHRINRLAANEVGIAIERVCDFYEVELAKLRAQLAATQDAWRIADVNLSGKGGISVSEPLWSTEQIFEYIKERKQANPGFPGVAVAETALAMAVVRDEMQARINELENQLRVTDANLTGDLELAHGRIRELEAQLAECESWEPVHHGEFAGQFPGEEVFQHRDMLGVKTTSQTGETLHASVNLPWELRLCRRVAQPQEGVSE